MPQRKAAKKSLKQDVERQRRNKGVKTRLSTGTKEFERALERGDLKDAEQQAQQLTKLLHQAAAKNVIQKRTAARRQGRMTKKLNAAKSSA